MTLNRLTTLNGLDPFSFKLGELVRAEKPQAKTGLKEVAGKPFLFLDIGTGAMQYLPPKPEEAVTTKKVGGLWKTSDDCLPSASGWYESYLAPKRCRPDRGVARWFDYQAKTWSNPCKMSGGLENLDQRQYAKEYVQAPDSSSVFHWIDARLVGAERPRCESLVEATTPAKPEPIKASDRSPVKSGWYPCSVTPHLDGDVHRYFRVKDLTWSAWVRLSTSEESRVKCGRIPSGQPVEALTWLDARKEDWASPFPEDDVSGVKETFWVDIEVEAPAKNGWYYCNAVQAKDADFLRYYDSDQGLWTMVCSPRLSDPLRLITVKEVRSYQSSNVYWLKGAEPL